MRQFILAKEYASTKISGFTEGQINVVHLTDDKDEPVAAFSGTVPSNVKGLQLVGLINGLPINIPIWKKLLNVSKMKYQEGAHKTVTVEIKAPELAGDYTLIVAIKGKGFNERNKYTASVYVGLNQIDVMTGEKLTAKLVEHLTHILERQGFVITNKTSDDKSSITIEAPNGVDFELLVADELTSVSKPTVDKEFDIELAGESMIKDMAAKAAADAGIEYTYQEASNYLYPTYPLDTATKTDSTKKYDVITIRFAEPRVTKTVDDVVSQVVQIAGPTGVFDTLYNNLSKLL